MFWDELGMSAGGVRFEGVMLLRGKVNLGHKLYFDKRMSINPKISCASCHGLETGGVDGLPASVGHDGTKGGRNAPTVLNAALHLSPFWDGRAKEVTKNEADRYFFKVPGLRNITLTGPYLHDGSVADLDVMVRMMAEYQLGKKLTEGEVKPITTFLKALEGQAPKKLVREPKLRASGPKTPKPKAG